MFMHYKKLLKSYVISVNDNKPAPQPVVSKPTIEHDPNDVSLVIEYCEYLKKNYFENIPYSEDKVKALLSVIPKQMFNYITKMMTIDAPISCQPVTTIYGLSVDDPETFTNLVHVLVDYDITNSDEVENFIIKNEQLIEQGDET